MGVRYIGDSRIYSYRFILKHLGKNVLLSHSDLSLFKAAFKRCSKGSASLSSAMSNDAHLGHLKNHEVFVGLFAVDLKVFRPADFRRMRYILSKHQLQRAKLLREDYMRSVDEREIKRLKHTNEMLSRENETLMRLIELQSANKETQVSSAAQAEGGDMRNFRVTK